MASSLSPPRLISVRHSPPELIVPAAPTPRELKKLSDIDDQEGLRFHVKFLMFYRYQPFMERRNDPVRTIKEALCKAMVFYYPLAGRLVEGYNKKLIVDCNGEGILFIEADANVTIDEIGDAMQPPCPYTHEFLYDVPGSEGIVGCPLLLIQVTRLACGGFVVAVRKNHAISDSLGLAKFLKAVGEIARGASEPLQRPVWQREILSARDPPQITRIHHEYEHPPITTRNTSKLDTDKERIVHTSFFFGPRELRSIRNHLPSHLRGYSTFELLTAALWRSWTRALQLDPNEVVLLSCFMNLRNRQGFDILPEGYYGNAFAFPPLFSRSGLLCNHSLGYALELVKKVKTQIDEEYIKSVADLMVLRGRPHYTTVSNFLVADTTRIGLGNVDFGWGKPVYGGPAGAIPSVCYFARFKNSKGEDGIAVPIILAFPVMERFRQEIMEITHMDGTYSSNNSNRSDVSGLSKF